jgi:hypothetical protein
VNRLFLSGSPLEPSGDLGPVDRLPPPPEHGW